MNTKNISRNTRRKLIYLAYSVCAKECPTCIIEQDSLVKRYPDINYGLYVSDTLENLKKLKKSIHFAFERRGYTIYTLELVSFMGTNEKKLVISGFYQKID